MLKMQRHRTRQGFDKAIIHSEDGRIDDICKEVRSLIVMDLDERKKDLDRQATKKMSRGSYLPTHFLYDD